MVSEALNSESGIKKNIDLSGLHNVTKKGGTIYEITAATVKEPAGDEEQLSEDSQQADEKQEMTFTEPLSLNTVTTDG